ncbi:MAG TPA: tRNA (adenosine(37)-N6)-threonylcarbamoyltransferase complex transferase subunit TsaD [Candidatus Deferrimicrobiaceae bacterium]
MRVLGIESSCDETAAAVYDSEAGLRSNVVSSQVAVHAPYGGVVPELASREHIRTVWPAARQALDAAGCEGSSIDGVAATAGPGLIGAVLVGLSFARALGYAWQKPVYGVDHLEAHIYAAFLEHDIPFPYVSLLVSGGHTSLFLVSSWNEARCLGATRDDAAGEAFDKAAKMMGLGYPGGVLIDRMASEGDRARIRFPRARVSGAPLDFSFSGLKTALRLFLESPEGEATPRVDVAASFQEAIVDALVSRAIAAARSQGVPRVVLAGGVSANSRLRDRMTSEGEKAGVRVYLPARVFCTDNAAMVALLGAHRLASGHASGLDLSAYASSRFSS